VVELALVLPILVLFVFGIIELTSAVREGARAVALGGDGAAATAAVKTGAPGLTGNQIAVTVLTPCPAGPNGTVQATYPFSYSIPFMPKGTWTLSAKGVMRCGG